MNQLERYQQAKRVTLLGAVINTLLGFLKLSGGIVFHSHALVADGLHSFADLFTDCMVLFASRFGSLEADETHPYGHQRIETAATLILALVLILTGAGIIWDALDEILKHKHDVPGFLTIPIAVFSILANEALFHYTMFIGKRTQSQLIIANAWHHRSDAASSVVVLVGLIGSLAGLVYLDAIAAIIVSLMIIKMGLNYGWDSVKELVDTAVDPQMLTQIESIIQQVDGVKKIHQLRSRTMGSDIIVDVHILVSPFISVSEGHYIAQHVHRTLIDQIEKLKDVTIHVDPEDDELVCPSIHLPNRKLLEKNLLRTWQDACPAIHHWILHYLDGKIYIDLLISDIATESEYEALLQRVRTDLQIQSEIAEIRFLTQREKISC